MKKTTHITILLITLLLSLVSNKAQAYDIAVENADGVTIYYYYSSNGTELAVTHRNDNKDSYSGNVVIPEQVTYMGRTRKVTSIGNSAFHDCSGLTSVTIPNSVTSIGGAFSHCTGLTSITIPNSVTAIGSGVLAGCTNLTSINMEKGNATYDSRNDCNAIIETKTNTLIAGCTNTIIPNSVTSIGDRAFEYLSNLTSITIPNSVTRIEESAFRDCTGLTSITIPNNVTYIGHYAFYRCSNLTSVTIGSSVKIIVADAFRECTDLTSITIPNSVTTIASNVFEGCNLTTVFSLIKDPFEIKGKTSLLRTFSLNTFNNATLYVPKGTIDKYRATKGWQDFLFIEEGDGTGDSETPEEKKCATPTISYANKQLKFSCKTEGVEFFYEIKDADIKTGMSNVVDLTATYNISVYANKNGLKNSDVATATLVWIEAEFTTDESSGVKPMQAAPVLIQANDGQISVEGAPEGTRVAVYDVNGVELGAAISHGGKTIVPAHIASGSVAIVKVGQKAVKVMKK